MYPSVRPGTKEHESLIARDSSGEISINWRGEAEKAKKIQDNINNEAQAYLDLTDRLFIRELDNGKPMPEGMKLLREEARQRIIMLD